MAKEQDQTPEVLTTVRFRSFVEDHSHEMRTKHRELARLGFWVMNDSTQVILPVNKVRFAVTDVSAMFQGRRQYTHSIDFMADDQMLYGTYNADGEDTFYQYMGTAELDSAIARTVPATSIDLLLNQLQQQEEAGLLARLSQ